MLNIIETDKKDVFAIGDIHGEFKAIAPWIKNNDLHDCAIIFCGDFGLGFDKINKTLSDLHSSNKACEKRNIDCYVIRGNHDDPAYYNDDATRPNLSRFRTLKDYTVIKSPEHNILCLGGAVSTDRIHRLNVYNEAVTYYIVSQSYGLKSREEPKCYWWEDEPFRYDEEILEEIIHSGIMIDTICSHAAPIICYPVSSDRVRYWCRQDANLEHDLRQEREDLLNLLNKLRTTMPIRNWIYGHYHEHHTDIIDGIKFTLLDMGRNGRTSSTPGGVFDMTQII